MKILLALILCAFGVYGHAFSQSTSPSWRFVGPEGGNVAHIAAWNDTLYAAADNGRLFRSSDGASWQEMKSLKAVWTLSGLSTQNGNVYAVFPVPTDFPGLFSFSSSANASVSWTSSFSIWGFNRSATKTISGVAFLGNSYFVADFQGISQVTVASVAIGYLERPRNLVSSTTMTCIAARGKVILGGTQDSVLHRSQDSGKTWRSGRLDFVPRTITFASDTLVFAASTNAIFRSVDTGISWRQIAVIPGSITIQSLAFAYNALYAATPLGVVRSQNLGQDWQIVNTGFSTRTISSVVANDSAVFVNVPALSGFHRLENERLMPFTLPNGRPPIFMGVTQTAFWATSQDSVLWRSVNGQNWLRIGLLPSSAATIYGITGQNQDRELYISTSLNIFTSKNMGQSWENVVVPPNALYPIPDPTALAISNDTLWMARCGILRSVDKGVTFQRLLFTRTDGISLCLNQLAVHNGTVYATGTYNNYFLGAGEDFGDCFMPLSQIVFDSSGLAKPEYERGWRLVVSRKGELLRGNSANSSVQYLPTNGTWRSFPPLPNTSATMTALGANGKNVYVGTNSGLFVLNAVATSVRLADEPKSVSEPVQIKAFPNPAFGDITVEAFLPRRTSLRLSVYNALGQEVAVLGTGEYEAGAKQFVWSAQGATQGVYVLRLQARAMVMTTKILRVQ